MQAVLPKSLSLNKLKTGASDDVPAWVPETCLAEVAFQVTDSRKLQRKTAQRREQKKKILVPAPSSSPKACFTHIGQISVGASAAFRRVRICRGTENAVSV